MAILTFRFVGRPTNYEPPPVQLKYTPLCIMCALRKPLGVVPVHGVCVKCGSDADSYGPKKIIKRRLTVR